MEYTQFAVTDNAEGQLDSNIGASTLSIILGAGQGALFPQPYSGTTTSLGDSVTLNKTGIGASGIAVGDYIENTTDGSHAYVTVVNTNSLTTTTLQGGSANIWGNGQAYLVNAFIGTLNKRNASSGLITASEQVKITGRSTDALTVATGGRGYNGTTAQTFAADDYFNLFVVARSTQEMRKAFADVSQQLDLKASIAYVGAALSARNWKDPVVCATTAAQTLATDFENGDTIDGVVLATNDRVMIKNQASPIENGIYTVNASGAPSRATDFDSTAEVTNAVVSITKGTSNADTVWICTSDSPTIGVNNIAFGQVGASISKASQAEARAAIDDTKFMTPAQTLEEMRYNRLLVFGGTGADGDLTVSGTTTLNLNQVYNYNNVAISGTLTFTGSGSIALLNIAGNLSGNGTIEMRNTTTGDPSVSYLVLNGVLMGGNQQVTVAANTGGNGGASTTYGKSGGAGGTSTVAGAGTGGAGGTGGSAGTAGAGGGSTTGGGGGGGGVSYGATAGTAGSNASGLNGGAGGAGGAGGSGAAGGCGGGGGGGYNTGNGGAGGAAGTGATGTNQAMGSGSSMAGGDGGCSGANGGNGGNGGAGGPMTNVQGATGGTSYRAGDGGNGGWGYAAGGVGGNGGLFTSSPSGGGTGGEFCGAGGNGGDSTYGAGGNAGSAGGYTYTTANGGGRTVKNGGNGGSGRTGGNGGNGTTCSGSGTLTGGNGGNGGAAKNGAAALYIAVRGNCTFNGTINAQGGTGGNGGSGGASVGATANSNGGNGGAGSRGADVMIFSQGTMAAMTINNLGGAGGTAGAAGTGGSGAAGVAGTAGTTGANGVKIAQQLII